MQSIYWYTNTESKFSAFCYEPKAGPLEQIPQVADRFIIMPNTRIHSGRVGERHLFTKDFRMEGFPYFTTSEPADGTFMGPEDFFLVRTAGCPLLVLTDGNSVGVAHAGLKSIIDYGRIVNNEPPRRDAGVLENFARLFTESDVPLQSVSVYILFGSVAREFCYPLDHEVYGPGNKKLYRAFKRRFPERIVMDEKTGAIDAALLAKAIAVELGFGNVEILAPISAVDGFATNASELSKRNYVGVIRL